MACMQVVCSGMGRSRVQAHSRKGLVLCCVFLRTCVALVSTTQLSVGGGWSDCAREVNSSMHQCADARWCSSWGAAEAGISLRPGALVCWARGQWAVLGAASAQVAEHSYGLSNLCDYGPGSWYCMLNGCDRWGLRFSLEQKLAVALR